MPNVTVLLKQEIARIARKEIRRETAGLQKTVAGYRHQIAQLKRALLAAERRLKVKTDRAAVERYEEPGEAGASLRWRADGFAKHRKRLGLSASDAAKIIGVSALSIYHWENGKSRPRSAQLRRIADFRALGKREAAARLAKLAR